MPTEDLVKARRRADQLAPEITVRTLVPLAKKRITAAQFRALADGIEAAVCSSGLDAADNAREAARLRALADREEEQAT